MEIFEGDQETIAELGPFALFQDVADVQGQAGSHNGRHHVGKHARQAEKVDRRNEARNGQQTGNTRDGRGADTARQRIAGVQARDKRTLLRGLALAYAFGSRLRGLHGQQTGYRHHALADFRAAAQRLDANGGDPSQEQHGDRSAKADQLRGAHGSNRPVYARVETACPRPMAAFSNSPYPMSSTRSENEGLERLQLKLSVP